MHSIVYAMCVYTNLHVSINFFKIFLFRLYFPESKGTASLAIENTTVSPIEPNHVSVKTTVKLLNPHALERSLFMAHDELQVVCDLDADEIRRCANR